METYGRKGGSIPGRFARWMLKVLIVNAALTGAAAYGLHRAFPAKTTAAWRAFWEPNTCELPSFPAKDPARAESKVGAPVRMVGKAKRAAPPSGGAAGKDCETDAATAAASDAARREAPVAPAGSNEVVVYGRDACGLTSRLRGQLDQAGIPYRYAVIDAEPGRVEMRAKLTSIGHSGGVGLPVVAVGPKVFIRPSLETISDLYRGP
ncbi:MAG: hypothetical protein HY553_16520 [Elusimicrobia bacterium]|nr:hypothetical protein [Elusimicrobiota bacterium]